MTASQARNSWYFPLASALPNLWSFMPRLHSKTQMLFVVVVEKWYGNRTIGTNVFIYYKMCFLLYFLFVPNGRVKPCDNWNRLGTDLKRAFFEEDKDLFTPILLTCVNGRTCAWKMRTSYFLSSRFPSHLGAGLVTIVKCLGKKENML